MKSQRTPDARPPTHTHTQNLGKKKGLTIPDFETYYKATVIKINKCGVGMKTDIQISEVDQSPKINPHKYSQMISDKNAKAIP